MPRWEFCTSAEIGQIDRAGMDIAILPVGATEQHGPHFGDGHRQHLGGLGSRSRRRAHGRSGAAHSLLRLLAWPHRSLAGNAYRWVRKP